MFVLQFFKLFSRCKATRNSIYCHFRRNGGAGARSALIFTSISPRGTLNRTTAAPRDALIDARQKS